MKIEIKYYGATYTVETVNDDLIAEEVLDIMTSLLIQMGYGQKSINEALKELADERHN